MLSIFFQTIEKKKSPTILTICCHKQIELNFTSPPPKKIKTTTNFLVRGGNLFFGGFNFELGLQHPGVVAQTLKKKKQQLKLIFCKKSVRFSI